MSNILNIWDANTKRYVGIPAIKGDPGGKGEKGDKPVKGVDYWTEDDKEEIVQEVSETFPTSLPANGGNADTVSGHTVATNVPANAKFTDTVYEHPGSGTNPHGTTKSDVGLGNVGNFKAVSTVASQGLTSQEKQNARANIGAGTSSFSGNYADLSGTPTIPTTLPASDVSDWAKQPNKPTYTASEVGARPNTWTPSASDVGAISSSLKTNYDAAYTHSTSTHAPTDAQKNVQSDWNATSGDAFIKNKPTSMPASDVSSWAKATSKPTYTASEVGARPSTWMPTASDVGAIPSSSKSNYDAAYTHSTSSHAPSNAQKNVQSDWNATSGDAMILNKPTSMPASDVSDWAKAATKPSYTASEVGARPNTWIPTAANVGAIATSARGAANGVASLDEDGKVPQSQLPISNPDWQQNDPEAPDYIKNRQGGYYTYGEVLFDGTISTEQFIEEDEGIFIYSIPIQTFIEPNKTYEVIFDNEVYELTAHEETGNILGNFYMVNYGYAGFGEPFCIYSGYILTISGGSHSIKITEIIKNKFDSEYIPFSGGYDVLVDNILFDDEVNATPTEAQDGYLPNTYIYGTESIPLSAENDYYVVIDGEQYQQKCRVYAEGVLYVGNIHLLGMGMGFDTEEPFLILSHSQGAGMIFSGSATHELIIYGPYANPVVFNKKYLPMDEIASLDNRGLVPIEQLPISVSGETLVIG